MAGLAQWLRRFFSGRRPPVASPRQDKDVDPDLKRAFRENRLMYYKTRRAARKNERAARGAAKVLWFEAMRHEGIRAAEEALDFLDKARHDAEKQ